MLNLLRTEERIKMHNVEHIKNPPTPHRFKFDELQVGDIVRSATANYWYIVTEEGLISLESRNPLRFYSRSNCILHEIHTGSYLEILSSTDKLIITGS
jgi:hypothetical protein